MKNLLPNTIAYTLFLSATVALGPLATDMYLPSLPTLVEVFGTTISEVQLTLSVFVVGIASFQLIFGPLTDRFGRKPVLLVGLSVFILSCVGCALAPSISDLILVRFIQSFGICAGIVIPRAMVRDLYERDQSAKQLSRMGSIMGLAPIIAPIIGGYLTVFYSWESIFVFLGAYGAMLFFLVLFKVKETLPNKDHHALKPIKMILNYRDLLQHREFIGYAMTAALCFSGLFTFISGSSFVLIEVIGIDPEYFGYYFGVVVIGYIAGTMMGPKTTTRFGLRRSLQAGVLFTLMGGLIMMLCWSYMPTSVFSIIIPMLVYNIGVGMVVPQCQAGAMAPFPEKAGAAAALAGFMLLGLAALLGIVVAQLYDQSALPMVSLILGTGVGACIWFSIFLNGRLEKEAQI